MPPLHQPQGTGCSAQIFASLEHRPALSCLLCSSCSAPRFWHAEAQAGAIPLPVYFSLEEVKQLFISIPGGISEGKNLRKKLFLLLLLQHLVPTSSLSGAPEIDFASSVSHSGFWPDNITAQPTERLQQHRRVLDRKHHQGAGYVTAAASHREHH